MGQVSEKDVFFIKGLFSRGLALFIVEDENTDCWLKCFLESDFLEFGL
jgi:hypothetical protein